MLDLQPATNALAAVVQGVRDFQLDDPTPSGDSTVATLLDHIDGLAQAFTACARKTVPPGGSKAPSQDADHLAEDWRTRIPTQLNEMAKAWNDPEAWTGMSEVGGAESPSEQNGMFGLNEVIVHGWDLAVATHQPFDVDRSLVEADYVFIEALTGEGLDGTPGLFAAPVQVSPAEPLLDRLVGLTGRDPGWKPA